MWRYSLYENTTGYIRYESLYYPISMGNMVYIIAEMKTHECKGLIIDVRNNNEGLLDYTDFLASFFFKKKTEIGYPKYKTGKGYNNFSALYKKYTNPVSSPLYRYTQKSVVVLTNRACCSDCNDFVNTMKNAKNVTILGDITREGRGGLPASSELPIGWPVHYSSASFYDTGMKPIESGIIPNIDIVVSLSDTNKQQGHDRLIEEAIQQIKK